jgi:Xaa-Pro aminopeptidase
MTERELAAELGHEMARLGATEPSFPIIVAEGANAAFPHAVPGDRRLREGSAVLIDWGATVDHYRSDLTRVIFIRRIPPRFRRMYLSVLAAQREGIAAIKPGVRMCDVDGKARRVLKRAGMGRQFSHGLGHGIGLDIHEAPRLSAREKEPLEAGMVVTVEPGVYLPGIGGIRIEDDVLVTDTGQRALTSLPTEIDEMVV